MNSNQNKGWEFKWSTKEDCFLKDNYGSLSMDGMLKGLPNRTLGGIHGRANKLGLKYLSYNISYFENIDSPEKAYWLGFIYADGCVCKDKFGIELSSVDIGHLEKFKKSISSNITIRSRNRNGNCSVIIEIRNSKFSNNLRENGIIDRKTYDYKFDFKVVSKFYRDFLRGFFDGDGTYMLYSHDRLRKDRGSKIYKCISTEISCVCHSVCFLQGIKDILIDNNIGCTLHTTTDGNYILRILHKDFLKFIDFLYYDNCLCLDRKLENSSVIKRYCLERQ